MNFDPRPSIRLDRRVEKMQPDIQKESATALASTIKSKELEELDCLQIREIMDALVYGRMSLEHADSGVKRILLRHLETCSACCRSFDVRIGSSFYGGGRGAMF